MPGPEFGREAGELALVLVEAVVDEYEFTVDDAEARFWVAELRQVRLRLVDVLTRVNEASTDRVLRVCGVHGAVRKVFEITGLDDVSTIH